MAATDEQMQVYCDARIRVRAEAARSLLNAIRDDRAAIDDVYARAVSNSGWADARVDGPPHLLQSGDGVSPDDVLNYNAFATALAAIIDGTGSDASNAATLRACWAVFQRACVRPIS